MKIIVLVWDDSKVIERLVYTEFFKANEFIERLDNCGMEYEIEAIL